MIVWVKKFASSASKSLWNLRKMHCCLVFAFPFASQLSSVTCSLLIFANPLDPPPHCHSEDDTVGDLKKLVAALTGTRADKIILKKWYTVYKDHITLADYEIHDGMNLELYYQ